MHLLTRFLVTILLHCFILTVLCPSFVAGAERGEKSFVKSGYCRLGRQIVEVTLKECQEKKGLFFATKEEALKKKDPGLLKNSDVEEMKELHRQETAPQVSPKPSVSRPPRPSVRKKPAISTAPLQPTVSPSPLPSPVKTTPLPKFMDSQRVLSSPKAQVPDQLQWPEFIDLYISDITITPIQPRIAQNFRIEATIKNKGVMTPQKDAYFQMEFTDDPYMQYHRTVIAPFSVTLPRLAPNEEHVVTGSITIPRSFKDVNNLWIYPQPGNYKVHAVIDTSNFDIDEEYNEDGNNEKIKTLIVRNPAPSDLVLDTISLTSDCRIKFKFHNDAAAIPDLDFDAAYVRVTNEDTGSQQKLLSEVDPTGRSKQAASSSWWWSTPEFVQYIWPNVTNNPSLDVGLSPGQTSNITVKVDANNVIRDENRNNNSKTWSLTCP